MKKFTAITVAILSALLFSIGILSACGAEEEFPTWKISSGITASFTDNGNYGYILTVEGSGKMGDFASKQDAPWYSKSGRVTEIEISDGITYIGSNSFTDCVAVKTVTLPQSVTSVGDNAFSDKTKVVWNGDDNSPEETTKKILFVGNSYTYYNDMPVIFENIAKAAGADVAVESITMGSHRLYMWADPTDSEGAKVYAALNAHSDYDMIVLQEQSTYPINHYDDFLSGAQTLAKKIAETQTNCRVYLYETWGSPQYGPNHGGIPEMELKLRTAYEQVAAAIGAKVSYVGKAFTYVYETYNLAAEGKQSDMWLYQDDNTHPVYLGSYLSACVHAATLLGIDPRTSTFNGQLDAATASLMQEIAYQIVFGS